MSLHPGKSSIMGAFAAVAAYEVEGLPKLVNFRHVLDALSEGRKNGLALSELEDYVDWNRFTEQGDKNAISYLSGSNPFGYAISFVAAQDDKGKSAYMPVIFDKLQDKTLVVGPAKLPPSAMRELRKANVTYVNQHDEKAPGKINDFLIETARYRGYERLMEPGQIRDMIEGMLGAVAFSGGTDGSPINGRSTIGSLLIGGIKAQAEPKIYVAAARPRILTR